MHLVATGTHDVAPRRIEPARTHCTYDIRAAYSEALSTWTDVGPDIAPSAGVMDLRSLAILELSTYTPNGARENLYVAPSPAPLEPMGFTGKESDEELGMTYFGERWLIPRLGRWASPDPLHVHASGGGEALNGYHYVSGNLLQARDPLGLCMDGLTPQQCLDYEAAAQVYAGMPTSEWMQVRRRAGIARRTVSPVVRQIVLGLKSGRVANLLIDRYFENESMGVFRLNLRDWHEMQRGATLDPTALWVNPDRSHAPSELLSRVGELHARLGVEGGEEARTTLTIDTPAYAQQAGTLGTYHAIWSGELTVRGDGTWSFEGSVHGEDFYDFDPRDRDGFSELQTRAMAAYGEGEGFHVATPSVPFRVTSEARSFAVPSSAEEARTVPGRIEVAGAAGVGTAAAELPDALTADALALGGSR